MTNSELITETIAFVKNELAAAEVGHDWFHIERVYKNALLLSKNEMVDEFIVSLAALLHDIADAKLHNGDESIGPKKATEFLFKMNVDEVIIHRVTTIISEMSFKNSIGGKTQERSIEFQVVQDADRLDAIGAIGIARCFNYGGFKNRKLYDPEIAPKLNMTKEEYKKSNGPTINHFYEKLLLLKDEMNTKTGKQIAEERHNFMESYLKQFYAEWSGEA